MKKNWCLALLFVFAIGICAAEIPNLQGKWTGSFRSCNEGNADSKWMQGNIIFNVLEQKDRLFSGNLTIKLNNLTEFSENFAGAIGLDNKTFYLAEFDKGYALGTIISNNELEYVYITDGTNASVAIDKLYRETNTTNIANPFAK